MGNPVSSCYSDAELAELLESRTGRKVRDNEWQFLEREDFVQRYRNAERNLAWLAERLESFRTHAPGGANRRERAPKLVARKVRRELSSAGAIALLAAREAEVEPSVVAFRRRELGGRLLSPADVEKWIKEREAEETKLPRLWIGDVPVPSNHHVRLESGRLVVNPPLTVDCVVGELRARALEYAVAGDEWIHHAVTAHGGVLETLRALSERLAKFHGWHPAAASVFVLTGDAPPPRRIVWRARGDTSPFARLALTIEIDPTLPPQELAKSYAAMRRQFITGERTRRLSEKHLRLALFVVERPEGEPWSNRMKAWNKAAPKWRYRHESNFRRDAAKVRQRLLRPAIPLGQVLSAITPDAEEKESRTKAQARPRRSREKGGM